MPELTHQKIQELKQTPRGQQILGKDIALFPALLKSIEARLQEQLARYDYLKRTGHDSQLRKKLLAEMLDEQLYWEFTYHIMFIKWRENKQVTKPSAS